MVVLLAVIALAPLPAVIEVANSLGQTKVVSGFDVPKPGQVNPGACSSATVNAKPAISLNKAGDPDDPNSVNGQCHPPDPPAPAPSGGPLHNKLIAFTSALDLIPGNDGGGDGIRGGIYVERADGTQQRKIITYATLRRSAVAHTFQEPDDHPSISPDGTKIAWASNRADTSQGLLEPERINWDIWVADINGENAHQLTSGPGLDSEPTWSPDSSKIYWATGSDPFFGQGDLDIWRMNPDGTGKEPIVAGPFTEFEPSISPDGNHMSFTRDFGGVAHKGYEIVVRQISPATETLITNNNGVDHDASWSASGARLFITSEKGNVKQPYGDIYRLNSSTGERISRTTNKLLSRGDPNVASDDSLIAAMEPLLPLARGPHVIDVIDLNGNNLGHVGGPGLVDIHPSVGPVVDTDGDSIPNYLESGSVGVPALDLPRKVRAGKSFDIAFGWEHPQAWRDLDSIEFFLTAAGRPVGAIRLLPQTGQLSAWDNALGGYAKAGTAGNRGTLRSGGLTLDLKRSRVTEVSATTITTRLRVKLSKQLAGHTFGVQVQGDDLDGDHQGEKLPGRQIRVRR
jgi:hypothetical protein